MAALSEDAIFDVARKINSQAARDAYLDQACDGDKELRGRLDELLAAYEAADSHLDNPPLAPTVVHADPLTLEKPGTQIGPYKLLQEIGEGGMGMVFMAEQTEPVERRVAIKIIKPGLDSKQVVARFKAERQALAMMDHPNIAKVLDAGATDAGRPYFVMELVKGVPITQYCDEHRLAPSERLDLFVQVCNAVQHAHQKGVVHRDLKPTNVLVALFDGEPVPKVIDFGVAKAISRRLTQQTLFTEYGQIVGTVEYMSPEQAQLNQLDVDTRSDVYSLGVLLYELLVGETPFDRTRLLSVAFDELLRIIRDEEPPKPSTRLSTNASSVSVAASRRVDAARLSALLRGEMDWIVMKALEKERGRRYETASALAADVRRYLRGDPIEARPQSATYRLRKFARRNKGPVIGGAVAFLMLIVGIVATSSALVWALNIRSQLRMAFIDQAFGYAMSGNKDSTRLAIENAETAGASPEWRLLLTGFLAHQSGYMDDAIAQLKEATERDPTNLVAWAILSAAYDDGGQGALHGQTVARLSDMTASSDRERLFKARAEMFHEPQKAVPTIEGVVERNKSWGVAHAVYADALVRLAWDVGDRAAAEKATKEIKIAQRLLLDSPRLHATALLANLTAAHLTLEEGEKETYLVEADRVANILRTNYPNSAPREIAVYHIARNNDINLAITELQQAVDAAPTISYEIWLRALMYQQGRYQEMFEYTGSPWAMAEIVEDPAEVVAHLDARLEQSESKLLKIWEPLVFCALGERNKAEEVWMDLLIENEQLPWNYQYPLMLFTGKWDQVRLFSEARGSRIKLGHAHFCMAHWYLEIEPDPEKAEEHFQKCIDQGILRVDYHYLSIAMLTRLRGDKQSWLRESEL